MIDGSRDISNSNELILAVRYFDEEQLRISNAVYDIFEQNQTKATEIYKSIQTAFEKDKVEQKSILCLMTDNAKDMPGTNNGLAGLMKDYNKFLYTRTCFCHSLNLVMTNLIKFIYKKQNEYDIYDVRDFVNENVSLIHYSYKLNDNYIKHSEAYLSKKHDENLYFGIGKFNALQSYAETRFLSLGQGLKNFIIQWTCRKDFYLKTLQKAEKLTKNNEKLYKKIFLSLKIIRLNSSF